MQHIDDSMDLVTHASVRDACARRQRFCVACHRVDICSAADDHKSDVYWTADTAETARYVTETV